MVSKWLVRKNIFYGGGLEGRGATAKSEKRVCLVDDGDRQKNLSSVL